MQRALAIAAFVCLSTVTLFALPVLLSGPHDHTCPLVTGQAVMCESTALEHISLFEAMLIALLTLALTFVARAWIIASVVRRVFRPPSCQVQRRPTLMQVLYARGILNRREYWL